MDKDPIPLQTAVCTSSKPKTEPAKQTGFMSSTFAKLRPRSPFKKKQNTVAVGLLATVTPGENSGNPDLASASKTPQCQKIEKRSQNSEELSLR